MDRFLVLYALLASVYAANTEVQFGSNTFLTPYESTLTPDEVREHADVKNTGALLFDSSGIENVRLSTNIPVHSFKSPQSRLFRAHPALVQCVQKTFNFVHENGKQIVITSGFRTASEIGDPSGPEGYDQSGTGAELRFKDGSTGEDILLLAEGLIRGCSHIFAVVNRDVGLIITEANAHIYMTGADDLEPHFESQNSHITTDDFKVWCQTTLDLSLDPKRTPTCDDVDPLEPNDVYPPHVTSLEGAVGTLDTVVTRGDVQDFGRLLQYPGTGIAFEDSESGSSWCGSEGNPCIACGAGIKGQALASRCADRTMSPRLYNRLNVLQKLVRDDTLDAVQLKVLDAWDEPHSDSPAGDFPDSLHQEGRAARLVLANSADLSGLSRLAVCAGFDYIQHRDDHIFVAVRKQAELRSQDVTFTNAILTAATPPHSQTAKYALPEEFSRVVTQYPVFDSDNMDNVHLTDTATLGEFTGSSRYLRITPSIASCIDALKRQELKWNDQATLTVVKGFQNNDDLPDMKYDDRGYSHLLGRAAQVIYTSSGDFTNHSTTYNIDRLVKSTVDACSAIFHRRGYSMGIGLYSAGVYIDTRDNFQLWTNDPYLLPPEQTLDQYKGDISTRIQFAIENRVVNPSSPLDICAREVPPNRQTHEFEFRHEHHVMRKRRKRAAGETTDESCNPTRSTPFCAETKPHRETEITHIWTEVMRKHLWRDEGQLREALDNCIGDCGTCSFGHIHEDKLEHCSNFLNWAPFDLMNDAPDTTNFYSLQNLETKRQACHGTRQCVSKAPLYALMVPSLDTLYRPDPQRSVQEELFSANDNPMPVTPIVHRMFAMHARGEVFVWVNDPAEIRELYHPLRVIFIFNREVTHVQIYVRDEGSISGVDQAVETMLEEWVSSSCPLNSRATTTPFTITKFPAEIVKRSLHNDFGEQLIEKRKYWERDWLKSTNIL